MNTTRAQRIWGLFAFFVLCPALVFLPLSVLEVKASAPATSNNRNANNYTAYDASTVKSYLYQEDDKLVRVEYLNGQLLVERYDAAFSLLSSQTVPIDAGFDRWGGFYAGEDYLYIIIGQENQTEDDDSEVIRIIQYDKNWNRLKQTGLYGANTAVPFDFGSLRCDEYSGMLYVHTCHSMYKSEDGLNHQANMLIVVRQSDMKITDAQYTVSHSAKGYVSHSFNQFVLTDSEGRLITLNHGDMYPRAAILNKYPLDAGEEHLFGEDILAYTQSFYLYEFPSNSFYQKTGASLGGLAETENAYITAYNSDGNGGKDNAVPRNVYLTVTDKNDFSASGTITHQLTSYAQDTYSAGTPVLVSDGLDGGYVLWNVQSASSADRIAYAAFDADGSVSTPVETDGMLSDCQPIIYNGCAVWYVTDNSSPVFFALDDSGIQVMRTSFSDVAEDSWYNDAVRYVTQKGLIQPIGEKFQPDQNADRGTLVYALYQLEGCPLSDADIPFSDVSEVLESAVAWAATNGIINGYDNTTFAPKDNITREQLAAIINRYADYKGMETVPAGDLTQFTDAAQISAWATKNVSWAVRMGLLSGKGNGILDPQGNTTRAELAAILQRFLEK